MRKLLHVRNSLPDPFLALGITHTWLGAGDLIGDRTGDSHRASPRCSGLGVSFDFGRKNSAVAPVAAAVVDGVSVAEDTGSGHPALQGFHLMIVHRLVALVWRGASQRLSLRRYGPASPYHAPSVYGRHQFLCPSRPHRFVVSIVMFVGPAGG